MASEARTPSSKAAPSTTTAERVRADYRALRSGAAWAPARAGRLRFTGRDALDLLNRLSTNKVDHLTEGQGTYTVLTTNKGRIIDLLFLASMGDHVTALTSPGLQARVVEWVDFYVFGEDIGMEDVTPATAAVEYAGPAAARVVSETLGTDVTDLAPYGARRLPLEGGEVEVLRTDRLRLPTFVLIGPSHLAGRLTAGAQEACPEAVELLRITQGVPAHPAELSEEVNPLEANLKAFIDFNKGCYVGQEVVARLNTYDKVQRYLVGLRWRGSHRLNPGDRLTADGRAVGRVTSVAPAQGGLQVALGFVRKALARPGVSLAVEREDADGVEVEVVGLPMALEPTAL